MSVTKDSTFAHFAAMAGKKYKVAFWYAQWAFCVDNIFLVFFITVL